MSVISTIRCVVPSAEIAEEPRPVTELERLFARELQFAVLELDSLRRNSQLTQEEPRLHEAYCRANRNCARAQRELARLRTAHIGRAARYTPEIQQLALAAPLAEPSRVPMPTEPVTMERHAITLIGQGKLRSDIFTFMRKQGKR